MTSPANPTVPVGSDGPSIDENQSLLFGHPTGLYTLFFAEMWERFSYYGMRALLLFYMIKGFLKYEDARAYSVYGAYTSLVYMTPFFGGMIADRLLGSRRAVVIGGLLMAAGHLLMTVETATAFYFALALLIVGNGFFKPNISTIVGSLYKNLPAKRDAGFTIFYMGINLGAAMSPLLCGYIGERYGWHLGFGLATAGMLTGLAVFVMPTPLTKIIIGMGAAAAALGLLVYRPDDPYATAVSVFVAIAIAAAGVIAVIALGRGGLPESAGRRPGFTAGQAGIFAGKSEFFVYAATALAVPVIALLVSGFSIFASDGKPLQIIPDSVVESYASSESSWQQLLAVPISEICKPAGLVLTVTGILAFGYLIVETFRLDRIARHRMFVVLILTFFALLFFAFFEQAGSSVSNFTDRNVDRVLVGDVVNAEQVGQSITLEPTQEQLGYEFGDHVFTLTELDRLRESSSDQAVTLDWPIVASNVGMKVASRQREMPASIFQAANAIFILIFGLAFSALWTWMGSRQIEPSTTTKFALGLLQLGLGFGAFWLGAQSASERGMVGMQWLLLGYLLHTTGELCLSPVGLSMVVKLSPPQLVSTVMGSWFLATAFSQYLAAIISQFTGVSHGGGDEGATVPPPVDTLAVYGDVFGSIAVAAMISAVICLALSPLLTAWMHENEPPESAA